jgi:hypothetical protein
MLSCPSSRQIVVPLLTKRCLFVADMSDEPTVGEVKSSPRTLIEDCLCPILHEHGYEIIPLSTTSSLSTVLGRNIQDIIDADLVVFDLCDATGDIFVLIGIRYLSGRPMVIFYPNNQPKVLPSSLMHARPIAYLRDDVKLTAAGTRELIRRLAILKEKPGDSICRPIFGLFNENPLTIGGIEITERQILQIEDIIKSNGVQFMKKSQRSRGYF